MITIEAFVRAIVGADGICKRSLQRSHEDCQYFSLSLPSCSFAVVLMLSNVTSCSAAQRRSLNFAFRRLEVCGRVVPGRRFEPNLKWLAQTCLSSVEAMKTSLRLAEYEDSALDFCSL